jgi:hypothetical protein
MGFLLSFAYGFVLAYSGLSWGCWQFWVLLILYFAGRILGIYEGSQN